MLSVLTIIDKLIKRKQIKNGFKRNDRIYIKQKTLKDYSILKYKTGSTMHESADIHRTMMDIVDEGDTKIVFDGEWKQRKPVEFELDSLPEKAKIVYASLLGSIEQNLPTNMLCYKDCYLIVTREDVLHIKERFQKINYLIEGVELKDFKEFMDKVNNHENFYQTIVTA